MSEGYMVPWTDAYQLAGNTWAAQTFTPIQDHEPVWLCFKCSHFWHKKNYILYEIRTTLAGVPTDEILYQGSYRFNTPKYMKFTGTLLLPLKDCPMLYTGTKYAVVIREGWIKWGSFFWWRYVKDTATYPRGEKLISSNAGETWTPHPNDDFTFSVWGYPPAPTSPPTPPIDHFAVLDVQQEITETGIKFIVATNVPCHLFMLWTTQEPLKHARPILRRGVLWKDAIRFCFVNWIQNEQEEEGDTLYHTFTKEPWPHCETRWFTFRAKVDDEWSPSAGPIFKKHRIAPEFWWILLEPWTLQIGPPPMTRVILEPWGGTVPPQPGSYVFWEPWGTYLTQYNDWADWNDPQEIEISFDAGIITLTNYGHYDCGIRHNPLDRWPLLNGEDQPLHLVMNNPDAFVDASSSSVGLAGFFHHPDKGSILFQLIFAWGAEFDESCPFGTAPPPIFWRGWSCVGTGVKNIDLKDFFQQIQEGLGRDTDPTGWAVINIHFGLTTWSPSAVDWLKNDYIGLYYPY